VRWRWVFSVVVVSATAAAHPEPPVRQPVKTGDFWREMLEPHADEVNAIVSKARELMAKPDGTTDTDWAVEQRARFFRDAKNLLAYARKLAPQNAEVLALLGRAADELGDTRTALDALEACVAITGTDAAMIDVVSRLGAIHIRMGDLDGAVRWLRLAQGPLTQVNAMALVNLANVLAAKGDTARAIDTLAGAMPTSISMEWTSERTLTGFALAVLYDRDEQRASAFSVLDGMQNGIGAQYLANIQNELARIRLPSPEDIFYYRGLLYESLGQYVEARTEWAHYVAAGDTPWRDRARAHIAAIDAQRRANPAVPAQENLNPLLQPNRRHP
jgi:tetratricopeptide (TPR) repeat protein